MRILYVEDNEVNRALVERVMRARQCSVVFEDEGEGALETLAKDSEIDLILLDIELAGSMTGLDVIRAMRARNDRRPVVAVTAYAMMGDRERFLEAGCDQYLPKPLVVTDLLNMVDHYQAELAKPAAQAAEPAPAEPTPAEPAPVVPVPPVAPAVAAPAAPAALAPAPAAPAAEVKPAESQPPVSPATTPAVPAAKPIETSGNGHRAENAKPPVAPVQTATPAAPAENPQPAAPTAPSTPSLSPADSTPPEEEQRPS